jgi:hypothetical protein
MPMPAKPNKKIGLACQEPGGVMTLPTGGSNTTTSMAGSMVP